MSRTVVSQQGSVESAFRLGYDAASHKWAFALAEKDAANSGQKAAKSNARAAAGVWTHLVGVYHGASREVKLYVASGARWGAGHVAGHSLELNGTNGSASTGEPVLYTGTARTVVAQRGRSGVDPFTLRYGGSRWSAEMSKWWRARADAVASKWTHLVAAYDASARMLKLTVG